MAAGLACRLLRTERERNHGGRVGGLPPFRSWAGTAPARKSPRVVSLATESFGRATARPRTGFTGICGCQHRTHHGRVSWAAAARGIADPPCAFGVGV